MGSVGTLPTLLMIAPAPVIVHGDQVELDAKFVEGMRTKQANWPSRMTVMLRRGATVVPFGQKIRKQDLPFDLTVLDETEPLGPHHLADHTVILASGDDFRCLGLVDLLRPDQKIVYVVEYTHETRMQILMLDRTRGAIRRASGMLWLVRQERRRRRAFRAADGLQCNGYPAYELYGPMNPERLLYLDGRLSPGLFATEAEMTAREERRASGAPLRLIFSGRLEPMKGAQDLLPIAQRLTERGVRFTLDIFGSGSLEREMAERISGRGGSDQVRLHAPVDFATQLVPFTRGHADIFLGCHRQSDPSCTYLEAMGCGVAVASYGNRMWARLNAEADAGWTTPLNDPDALADRIAEAAADPQEITRRSRNALAFAKANAFPDQFRRRMQHLARIAETAPRAAR